VDTPAGACSLPTSAHIRRKSDIPGNVHFFIFGHFFAEDNAIFVVSYG
jgi:hypothetical protein